MKTREPEKVLLMFIIMALLYCPALGASCADELANNNLSDPS